MNKKAFIIFTLILAIIIGSGFWFLNRDNLAEVEHTSLEMIPSDLDEPLMPPPLRGAVTASKTSLSVNGVLSETNRHRGLNDRKPLTLNSQLNAAAQLKLDDMFAKQYFAHESPDGKGPSDLAKQVGYAYVTVGENLALGNFEGDSALVQGWMDSPGHRENILRESYTEIGIAVKEGIFEGKRTWLAVQEFGLPATACPKPDTSLEALINKNQQDLKNLETQINAKRREVDEAERTNDPSYNQKAGEYNDLVNAYNELIQRTKKLVNQYNQQVESYNACLKQAGG